MKTLLLATDLAASSENVAAYAYRLAQTLKAKLLLCYTMNVPAEIPQAGVVAWPLGVYEDMDRDSQAALKALKHKLLESSTGEDFTPEVVCLLGAGLVTDVVTAEAARHKADLIIMRTHANDRLSTWLIGNHSRKMIEAAMCPLLLVPGDFAFRPIAKIAFASDFKHPELDIVAINQLVSFAKKLNAELVLAHVIQHNKATTNDSIVKDLLTNLARNHGHQQVSVKVVKSEHVADGLTWLVRHEHIDMLTMVHNRHSFLGELLHGSRTQQIADNASVPLLVFNSHEHAD
ncbi:universal stress protein [Mucilaginibacter sp. 14171R-50]|uniref:universal stress protein n=1 Tax=Mucilaginibacter sp. 14171R-50 TaxID=2703789 RepID=UPI00138BAD6A|nr:universal stress protein [Mucilaginibacter sp. 14171R-50]QHS55322.1 universal stress protein [Mucilaginibacter sp. 14171R-50]